MGAQQQGPRLPPSTAQQRRTRPHTSAPPKPPLAPSPAHAAPASRHALPAPAAVPRARRPHPAVHGVRDGAGAGRRELAEGRVRESGAALPAVRAARGASQPRAARGMPAPRLRRQRARAGLRRAPPGARRAPLAGPHPVPRVPEAHGAAAGRRVGPVACGACAHAGSRADLGALVARRGAKLREIRESRNGDGGYDACGGREIAVPRNDCFGPALAFHHPG